MTEALQDLLVIGGGINGTGIARDAAGRGLRVTLCEMGDLAQATSSSSTKLIHGGLRYLEHYEFRLVRHALAERERLLASAPHIIWPLRFVLPHHASLRPRWKIRIGLFLYDHLGGRQRLPGSRQIALRDDPAGEALQAAYLHGFEYADCWVQDARLVVLNARDAAARGASVLTRTRCIALQPVDGHWQARLRDQRNGREWGLRARAVVNASGPWVEQTLGLRQGAPQASAIRLVKGSHIVVRRRLPGDCAFIFQHPDGRVLFAIPFEGDHTLLGTTEVEVGDDPTAARIDTAEVDYICAAVSGYLREPVRPADVVWSYSGVRPLVEDAAGSASAVTREYRLQLDTAQAPLLSVLGGKITTYRLLAEAALAALQPVLGIGAGPWTDGALLPGGDIGADFDAWVVRCRERYPWLPAGLLADYARNYGSDIDVLLAGCGVPADLGREFGGGLYERELAYLVEHEWAETAEDVLWRRSKKGLRLSAQQADAVEAWLEARRAGEVGHAQANTCH